MEKSKKENLGKQVCHIETIYYMEMKMFSLKNCFLLIDLIFKKISQYRNNFIKLCVF